MTGSNRQVISVSRLTKDARRLLEGEFASVYVEGEISNLAQPSSGHWYFTLKDEGAQVRCAMFKNRNQLIRFKPRSGQQIIVRGRVSLYEARGEFQMIAEFMEEAGDGALRAAFEKLKATLLAEGLFDEARKKPVPPLPNHIAIITSPTGAAVRDVMTVMKRRFPAIHTTIVPVQVQGEGSVAQIVQAIRLANEYTADPFDLILLTRGGGSLEDLWSFNTEPVARAIAASRLPLVCAVGHEVDVSIADFVADLRAPTPSAAAELITPDSSVWRSEFDDIRRELTQLMLSLVTHHQRELGHLRRRLRHPEYRLQDLQQRFDDIQRRLISLGQRSLSGYRFDELTRRLKLSVDRQLARLTTRLQNLRPVSPLHQLKGYDQKLAYLNQRMKVAQQQQTKNQRSRFLTITEKLHTLSPLATLERGYAIVSAEPDGAIVRRASELAVGTNIRARLLHGEVTASVTSIIEGDDN